MTLSDYLLYNNMSESKINVDGAIGITILEHLVNKTKIVVFADNHDKVKYCQFADMSISKLFDKHKKSDKIGRAHV